jgi:hypothetical protein
VAIEQPVLYKAKKDKSFCLYVPAREITVKCDPTHTVELVYIKDGKEKKYKDKLFFSVDRKGFSTWKLARRPRECTHAYVDGELRQIRYGDYPKNITLRICEPKDFDHWGTQKVITVGADPSSFHCFCPCCGGEDRHAHECSLRGKSFVTHRNEITENWLTVASNLELNTQLMWILFGGARTEFDEDRHMVVQPQRFYLDAARDNRALVESIIEKMDTVVDTSEKFVICDPSHIPSRYGYPTAFAIKMKLNYVFDLLLAKTNRYYEVVGSDTVYGELVSMGSLMDIAIEHDNVYAIEGLYNAGVSLSGAEPPDTVDHYRYHDQDGVWYARRYDAKTREIDAYAYVKKVNPCHSSFLDFAKAEQKKDAAAKIESLLCSIVFDEMKSRFETLKRVEIKLHAPGDYEEMYEEMANISVASRAGKYNVLQGYFREKEQRVEDMKRQLRSEKLDCHVIAALKNGVLQAFLGLGVLDGDNLYIAWECVRPDISGLGKVLKALALSYGYHNGCVWSSLELSGGRFLNPVAYRVNCTLGYTSDSDAKYEIFFKKEFKIDKGEIKDYVASITTQSEYDNVKRKLMDYFKRFTLAGKKRKRRQTDRQKVAVSASYMMKMNLDEGAVRNAYDQARTSHERDLENRISPRA